MNLYVFDTDGYGEWWAVMSESPEDALAAVQRHIADNIGMYGKLEAEEWARATLDALPSQITLHPRKYFLKVYEQDSVLGAEWS